MRARVSDGAPRRQAMVPRVGSWRVRLGGSPKLSCSSSNSARSCVRIWTWGNMSTLPLPSGSCNSTCAVQRHLCHVRACHVPHMLLVPFVLCMCIAPCPPHALRAFVCTTQGCISITYAQVTSFMSGQESVHTAAPPPAHSPFIWVLACFHPVHILTHSAFISTV